MPRRRSERFLQTILSGHGDQGRTVHQLPSGRGWYFIYRPPLDQPRAVRSSTDDRDDDQDAPDSYSSEANGLPAPRAPASSRLALPRRRRAPERYVPRAGVGSIRPENHDCFRANLYALIDLPSADPPERCSVRCCRHGKLEQDMHRERCKSFCFVGRSKLRMTEQHPSSPLQFVSMFFRKKNCKHGMEIAPEELQKCKQFTFTSSCGS